MLHPSLLKMWFNHLTEVPKCHLRRDNTFGAIFLYVSLLASMEDINLKLNIFTRTILNFDLALDEIIYEILVNIRFYQFPAHRLRMQQHVKTTTLIDY